MQKVIISKNTLDVRGTGGAGNIFFQSLKNHWWQVYCGWDLTFFIREPHEFSRMGSGFAREFLCRLYSCLFANFVFQMCSAWAESRAEEDLGVPMRLFGPVLWFPCNSTFFPPVFWKKFAKRAFPVSIFWPFRRLFRPFAVGKWPFV